MSPIKFVNFFALIAIFVHSADAHPYHNNSAFKVEENEFPSTVSLSFKGGNSFLNHFCTGVLISKKHVLTAAHCIEDLNEDQVEILAGSHDLRSANIKNFNIKSWITYKQWALQSELEFNEEVNDVAVIELDLTDTQIPYARILYVRAKKLDGLPVKIVGWGRENKLDDDPIMRKFYQYILPKKQCIERVKDIHMVLKKYIGHRGLMCTIKKTNDSCSWTNGYSGAPILIENKILVAIHVGKCPKKDPREVSVEAYMNYHKNFIRYATRSAQEYQAKNNKHKQHVINLETT